jgi:mannose-6-phosphate isomerase-like protein (cupin superfamily)
MSGVMLFGRRDRLRWTEDENARESHRRPPVSDVINIAEKLTKFADHWHPRILAQVDMYYVKVAKLQGEFVWHNHMHQDEMFLVLSGEVTIKMKDRSVRLAEGEMFVVPRGVDHCPEAQEEAAVLLFERVDTPHTGDVISKMTVTTADWI